MTSRLCEKYSSNHDNLANYAVGVTREEKTIPGITSSDFHTETDKIKIALIGGLSDDPKSEKSLGESIDNLLDDQANFTFISTYLGDVRNEISSAVYPPGEKYYFDETAQEALYLWRWLTINGPDLIVEIFTSDIPSIQTYGLSKNFQHDTIKTQNVESDQSLLGAIASGLGDTPGNIPSIRINCTASNAKSVVGDILQWIKSQSFPHSPARKELDNRSSRNPLEVARVLDPVYGHKLDEPIGYVQGVAVSGRLRLRQLDPTYNDPTQEISAMVDFLNTDEGYNGNATKGNSIAALCWAEELFEATGEDKWKTLLLKAADTYQETLPGEAPTPCDPNFWCEDMFFMSAILGRAHQLTGKSTYADMLIKFLFDANIQQADGLFWHSKSGPFFWGRGNGFGCMAYAETLTYLSSDHPEREKLLGIHKNQLAGLIKRQGPSGMWTQLLDFPGTYEEFSSTCMIGYSMARGINNGWLKKNDYKDSVLKAWNAVNRRISSNADLVDVCTGTGVQEKRSDYLYRAAVNGYDDRGGSMAFWFSTEMARL